MSKKQLVIVLAGVLLVLVLGMGAGFYLLLGKIAELNHELDSMSKQQSMPGIARTRIGPKYPLDALIVNLADPGGNRYLRVTMELEITGTELEEELKQRSSQIKDSLLMIISTKRLQEVNSAEGKNSLRAEIVTAMNSLLETGSINNIYFTEFVIQ